MHSSPDVRATIVHGGGPAASGTALIPRHDALAAARLAGFREGREAGFVQGREEGRAAAEAAVAGALGALLDAIEDVRTIDAGARLEIERTAVELAVELASVILEREIELGETGRDAITRALGLRRGDEAVRVRLHPADADQADRVRHPGVEIVADPALGRGEAVAELGDGFADLSIGAALDRVREALR